MMMSVILRKLSTMGGINFWGRSNLKKTIKRGEIR
jgi:hypothetical protein